MPHCGPSRCTSNYDDATDGAAEPVDEHHQRWPGFAHELGSQPERVTSPGVTAVDPLAGFRLDGRVAVVTGASSDSAPMSAPVAGEKLFGDSLIGASLGRREGGTVARRPGRQWPDSSA